MGLVAAAISSSSGLFAEHNRYGIMSVCNMEVDLEFLTFYWFLLVFGIKMPK
jgi:hypothetical protein